MIRIRQLLTIAVATATLTAVAACGDSGSQGAESGPVEVVTHNAVAWALFGPPDSLQAS